MSGVWQKKSGKTTFSKNSMLCNSTNNLNVTLFLKHGVFLAVVFGKVGYNLKYNVRSLLQANLDNFAVTN